MPHASGKRRQFDLRDREHDAGDAEALAAIAREDADFAKVIDQHLQLYRRSIEDMRLRPIGEEDYTLALSGFLREVLPRSGARTTCRAAKGRSRGRPG